MRILRITVENLASLNGRQTVDFTTEPLRSAGLFAIIGPTGSGKSTLLDAMCLALYDKTPRLKQAPASGEQVDGVSQQDSRSLLRRGAVEGSAEVAFLSTDGQTLTARWSVRRARRKITGQLQPVEMALFRGDVRDGQEGEQVCGGKKTAVLEAIEQRIGLKFEQFTRAVLLAQNEFATFLRSKDEERMEILEALTGTHQFRAISQAVFKRASAEKASVAELQNQRRGQVPLAEPERAAAEERQQKAEANYMQVSRDLEQLQELKRWHEEYARRHAALTAAEKRHQEARRASDAAEPRRRQLSRIELAQREARALHSALVDSQERRAETEKKASSAAERREAADKHLTESQQAEGRARTALEELLETQKADWRKLEAASSVLLRIQPAERALSGALGRLENARERFDQLKARKVACEQAIEDESKRRDDTAQKLQTLQCLDEFATEAGLWISCLQTLETAISQERNARESVEKSATAVDQEQKKLDAFLAASRVLETDLEQRRQQLKELESQRHELDGEQLRRTEAELLANQRCLSRLLSQLESWDQLNRGLEELKQRQGTETLAQQHDEQRISDLIPLESAAALQRNGSALAVTHLSNAFDDHAKRLRTTLEQGQKCPVCGATEHPFANDPSDLEVDVLQSARAIARANQADHEKLRGELDTLRVTVQLRLTQLQSLQQQISAKAAEAERFLFENQDKPIVAEILALPAESRLQRTQEAADGISNELRRLAESLGHVAVLGRQIVELQGECSRLQESLQQRAQEHVGLSAAAASVQQQADTWKSLLHERIEGRTVAENVLESLWSALPDARAEFMADSAEFRRQLQEKFAQLRNLREQLADATQSLRQPESQIPELLKDLQLAEKAWLQHQQEYGDAQQDLNHLQQQLQQLLGAQSAEQFRQTIENREQSARKKLDDAAIVRSEADKARTAAATQYQTLQHQLESETQAETTARSTLNTWLGKFSPDSGLDQALTELRQLLTHDSDWIEDERRALDKFSSEVNAAAGESNSCRQRLDEYLRQRTDDRDEAAVLEAIEVQRQRVENAEAERQDARLILQKDDDTRGKNLELDGRITAAELAAKPWLELNQLIGSADGKTFTLMAQRYTLDLLLQHANVQLRELARRYRLERLGDSLNLAVIDQDLGDELRSVHSLSGGETFLVSLALALGLASLTSSRLRIESLFIDEGFGSLDEDTLEVAMNALNHLQSQGRKVGIITHVERMQDAITTRIQIRRGPGSTSRIVLPRAASAESHD